MGILGKTGKHSSKEITLPKVTEEELRNKIAYATSLGIKFWNTMSLGIMTPHHYLNFNTYYIQTNEQFIFELNKKIQEVEIINECIKEKEEMEFRKILKEGKLI